MEDETEETTKLQETKKNKGTNVLIAEASGFLLIALATYIFWSATLTATEDILQSSSHIPSSINVLCLNLPYFIVSLILPYFVDKFSLMTRALSTMIFNAAGVVIMATMPTAALKLVGVALLSVGQISSEGGLLPYTSFHQDFSLYWFVAGTGVGQIVGAGFYTGLTTSLCISPQTTLLLTAIPALIFPLAAWVIRNYANTVLPTGTEQEYIPLNTASDHEPQRHVSLTWSEKLEAAKENLYLVLPVFVGMVSTFTTMQAVVTTLAFRDVSISPVAQFRVYNFVYSTGLMLSTLAPAVLVSIKPNCHVLMKKLWILTVLVLGFSLFLVLESLFHFVRSFIVIVIVCLFGGMCDGSLYFNSFATAGINSRPRYKEFSRAFMTLAFGGGIVLAGFLGLLIEPALRNHCEMMNDDGIVCLTRTLHSGNETLPCFME